MNIMNVVLAMATLVSLLVGLIVFASKLFGRLDKLMCLPDKVESLSQGIDAVMRELSTDTGVMLKQVVLRQGAEIDDLRLRAPRPGRNSHR